MSSLAYASPAAMERLSQELDHERRFQPPREAAEAFLWAIHPWTEVCVYDAGQPHAFTRTTYFDTEGLDFLGSRGSGRAQRLRLREYAGTADLAQPPVLTGPRFLEVKVSTGERRMKSRSPLSQQEADALLSGTPLPEESSADALLRQLTPAPVRPWVTAWYRRGTRSTPDGKVRITLDEELTFALPPPPGLPGTPAAPTRLLQHFSAPLLEVKWRGRAPPWLEQALWTLAPSETHGSKFEQGMRALFGGALPLPLRGTR